MQYYYHPMSPNCRKCSALIRHLGLELEWHEVNLPRGEQLQPEFLAVNPNGMVPVLVDGRTNITESNAIVVYLGEKEMSELWPEDRLEQLGVLQWMFWEQSHFMFACGTVFFQRLIKPMIGQTPDEVRVDEALGKFRRHAAVLESVLENTPYLLGESLSLADWAVAGHLSLAGPMKLPVAEFPAIGAWMKRLDETDAWKQSAPQLG